MVDSPGTDQDVPTGRSMHRHAKSVTFDAAPPQVNEYEMATPDLSSVGTNSREGSYESIDYDDDDDMLYDPARVDLADESFDASLEDTDKTPVVGPDDWRGDSPMVHPDGPREYEGSPLPEKTPSTPTAGRPSHIRTDSIASNGEHRPLPPLPGLGHSRNHSIGSSPAASPGLSATAERMLGSHRSLPPPPPASSTSKSDIQNIGNTGMSLEERLRLMMLSDNSDGKSAAEQQRERRLRRANGRERLYSPSSEPESMTSMGDGEGEEDDIVGDMSALDDYELPPRLNRDSIMRRVNGNTVEEDNTYNFSSPPPSSRSPSKSPERSPERRLPLDPDVPIPSTESPDDEDEFSEGDGGSVIITRMAEDDDDIEFYEDSDIESESDMIQHPGDTDSESHYSEPEPMKSEMPLQQAHIETTQETRVEIHEETRQEATTPRATTPTAQQGLDDSLPDFASDDKDSSFSRDFESYMLTEPEQPAEVKEPERKTEPEAPKMADAHAFLQRPFTPEPLSKPEYDGSGWGEPEEEHDEGPGTPDSVIHHPIHQEEDPPETPLEVKNSPAIPERYATIKASGSKLKTRISNTPSDIAAMRDARRHASVEVPDVPPIPDRHSKRLSRDINTGLLTTGEDFLERHPSFKNRSLTLDLDLGLSLDQDFERVIEAQKVAYNHSYVQQYPIKNDTLSRQASTALSPTRQAKDLHANVTSRPQRGYLMRQNTKLVTANDRRDPEEPRGARSAGNSPVKQERPMSCIVEPWNNKPRPKSMRKRLSGPVPPMPGQESNATAVTTAVEEDLGLEIATPESGERGRLFVKVMGVKDLDLPLPKSKSISASSLLW